LPRLVTIRHAGGQIEDVDYETALALLRGGHCQPLSDLRIVEQETAMLAPLAERAVLPPARARGAYGPKKPRKRKAE
jgi:hypothetical protein